MNDPNQFIGCVLSIKTKPKADGAAEAIIGTVRAIDLDQECITLDEVMCNGQILEDGYVLMSASIADLLVCGKAEELSENFYNGSPVPTLPSPAPEYEASPVPEEYQSSPVSVQEPPSFPVFEAPPQPKSKVREKSTNANAVSKNAPNPVNGNGNGSHEFDVFAQFRAPPDPPISKSKPKTQLEKTPTKRGKKAESDPPTSSAFVKASAKKEQPSPKNFYALNPLCAFMNGISSELNSNASKVNNTANISTEPKVVYTASELEQDYFAKANFRRNSGGINTNSGDKRAASQKTFIELKPKVETKPVAEENKKTVDIAALKVQTAEAGLPTQLERNVTITEDNPLFQFFGPHQVLPAFPNRSSPRKAQAAGAAGSAPKNGRTPVVNNFQSNSIPRSPRGKSQPLQSQQNQYSRKLPSSTFEMTNAEIQAEEFDFAENLAMFEKLPVNSSKPTNVHKNNPQFYSSDTTYLAERTIDSIKLNGSVPEKVFVTDTGIQVPGVKLSVRNTILNAAHNYGLSHDRTIEVMGRAVAQTCVPLLGDTYRLSPERVDDRPRVLVCTGPHWQGAVGICAARILATQGIVTCVYACKEELAVCAIEEKLYGLTEQKLTRDIRDCQYFGSFDLVILAVNDHLETELTVSPFIRYMKNRPVVLVDPPLLPSYPQAFLEAGGVDGSRHHQHSTQPVPGRIIILSPTLPLAYPADKSVKLFLVNMGIPVKVFEENDVMYKSPFGDKLILQIFSSKQDCILNNA